MRGLTVALVVSAFQRLRGAAYSAVRLRGGVCMCSKKAVLVCEELNDTPALAGLTDSSKHVANMQVIKCIATPH